MLGNAHPDTGHCYNNIGNILQYQGNYEEALVEYRKALDVCEKVHGPEHPDTARCHNNIGVVFKNTGDYDSALVEYKKALSIWEVILGQGHPDTVICHHNISVVLRCQQNQRLFDKGETSTIDEQPDTVGFVDGSYQRTS